jgi:glyoxylase-like metal-dependent hydrolase (beta-lactamase superfamily II)
MQVADRIERVSENIVNFYLVEDAGRVTVVDAGMPGNWGLLVDGLARIGRTLADIEAVVLTHAHSDHVGIAERIRSGAPADALIHAADLEYLLAGKRPPGGMERGFSRRLLSTLVYGLRKGGIRMPPVAEARAFADGDVLDLPGSLRVVHAPGHTPGACALLCESRGALLTGDAMVTLDFVSGRAGPCVSPLNTDRAEAIGSLARLDGLPASIVLPGHGEPFVGTPTEAVALARSRDARSRDARSRDARSRDARSRDTPR